MKIFLSVFWTSSTPHCIRIRAVFHPAQTRSIIKNRTSCRNKRREAVVRTGHINGKCAVEELKGVLVAIGD